MDTAALLDRFTGPWPSDIDVPDAWLPRLIRLDQSLAAIDPEYKIMQVKVMFGGLRYYYETMSDYICEMDVLVDAAEKELHQ